MNPLTHGRDPGTRGPARAPGAGKPPLAARLMRATWRGLPAKRHEAGMRAGLRIPAADGSPLVTDHYFPRAEGEFPTLLVRSPYGRGLPWAPMYGMLFAEQGFHVVLQSCRGTGGSGGAFDLWRNETPDGLAAVDWLREQPWFTGDLGTIGPSYLGYTQWALAENPPPELRAMVVQVGLHDPYALFHADGVPRLENVLAVGAGLTHQHRGAVAFLRAALRLRRHLRALTTTLPLRTAYRAALGGELPWLDQVLALPDPEGPYWRGASRAAVAERHTVPTALVTGRYDVLVDQTFAQYERLRRAGCETSLLVGPWTHTSALQQGWPEVFAESLAWLRAHLCGDRSGLRPTRVRVHLGGTHTDTRTTVRDLDDWPHDPAPTAWHAAPDGHLTEAAPAGPEPLASLRHDPADPAPSVGGPLLAGTAGERDMKTLEARDDVLTFTGPVLTAPLDVLGPVAARLRVSTGTGHADVFSRLCDVDPDGRSVNVCDGFARVPAPATTSTPADANTPAGAESSAPAEMTVAMTAETTVAMTVTMSPTAHRFAAGHRLRWQISGAAHPRYARNPGTGAAPLDATSLTPVRLTLHPGSALLLPRHDPGPDAHE